MTAAEARGHAGTAVVRRRVGHMDEPGVIAWAGDRWAYVRFQGSQLAECVDPALLTLEAA